MTWTPPISKLLGLSAKSVSTLSSEETEVDLRVEDSRYLSSLMRGLFKGGDNNVGELEESKDSDALPVEVNLIGIDWDLISQGDPEILKMPPSQFWLMTFACKLVKNTDLENNQNFSAVTRYKKIG